MEQRAAAKRRKPSEPSRRPRRPTSGASRAALGAAAVFALAAGGALYVHPPLRAAALRWLGIGAKAFEAPLLSNIPPAAGANVKPNSVEKKNRAAQLAERALKEVDAEKARAEAARREIETLLDLNRTTVEGYALKIDSVSRADYPFLVQTAAELKNTAGVVNELISVERARLATAKLESVEQAADYKAALELRLAPVNGFLSRYVAANNAASMIDITTKRTLRGKDSQKEEAKKKLEAYKKFTTLEEALK